MCGIVGYVGRQDAVPILVEGLARLEYRGYDSAGVAVVKNGALRIHKAEGKVRELRRGACPSGSPARRASPTRAGPRTASRATATRTRTSTPPGRIAVVHNGILENAAELRAELEAAGVTFASRHRHRGASRT